MVEPCVAGRKRHDLGLGDRRHDVEVEVGQALAGQQLRLVQVALDTRVQFGMAPHQFLENAHRANAGIVLQHRHNLGVKNIGQRVWTPPSPRGFLLRGKCRIPLDPVAGGSTETCLRGGYFSGAGFPVFHERPHLVISYMAAGPLALLYREYRETITDRPQSPKEDRQNFYPAAFNYNRTTPFLR